MAAHDNNPPNDFNIDHCNGEKLTLEEEPVPKRRVILSLTAAGMMLSFAAIATMTTLLVVGKEPTDVMATSLEVATVPSFNSVATSPVMMFGLSALQRQTSCFGFLSHRSPFRSL